MDQVVDLDAAAQVLERYAETWRGLGLTVGPITWTDGQTTVSPVTTDRSAVRGDYSCAIRLQHGSQEGLLVLYAGGWCDRTFVSVEDDVLIDDAPGWDDWLDLRRFESVVDEFGRLFKHA